MSTKELEAGYRRREAMRAEQDQENAEVTARLDAAKKDIQSRRTELQDAIKSAREDPDNQEKSAWVLELARGALRALEQGDLTHASNRNELRKEATDALSEFGSKQEE